MFDKWRKTSKSKRIKNTIAIVTGICLVAGATTGIVMSSLGIANTINIDSDFDNGRNIQLNFELTDANGNFIQNIQTENELLEQSSTYLVKQLELRGLTNIKVNYGFQYKEEANTANLANTTSIDANPSINGTKKITRYGSLIATFDENESILSLKDVKNEVNRYYNDAKIFNTFSLSNRYSIEIINANYGNKIPSTNRWSGANLNQNSLFVNKQNNNYLPDGTLFSFINYKDNYDYIKAYVDKDNNTSDSKIDIQAKQTYNVGAFVNDFNDVNKIKEANPDQGGSGSGESTTPNQGEQPAARRLINQSISTFESRSSNTTTQPSDGSSGDSSTGDGSGGETPPESSTPSPVDQYQTTATWVIWNDKDGLINYLNNLIIAWYFNYYANPPANNIDITKLNKDNINEQLFNTAEFDYPNYVDVDLRKQINTYISSLTDIEKQFMAFCAVGNAGASGTLWHPALINENNLIPTLYDFYTSPEFSGYTKPDPNNSSKSELNGWGWIESDAGNTPVEQLLGEYLVGFVDYRNFQDYFINPNPPDTSNPDYKETDPIEPYYDNNLILSNPSFTANQFVDILTNNLYQFPLVLFNQQKLVNDWPQFEEKYNTLSKNYPANNAPQEEFDKYYKECSDLANANLSPSVMFSSQYMTKPLISNGVGGLSSLTILFIIISAIIFLVGIFISIRYRMLGFTSFILAALTYVLSILIYSSFKIFGFSFFTLIASTINTFLAFLISFFFCKKSLKEIVKSANVTGTIVNSIKKYWRLSLDVNAVLILSSLAFLFFGEINNKNVGAILIVSSFLSFILNGVIYFVLILFYVVWLDINYYGLFASKIHWKWTQKHLNKINESKFSQGLSKTFVKVNYFSKWAYISFAVILVLITVGTILLFVINPIASVDFTGSNIIYINNFDTLGLTQNQIINILGVNSFNNYVYDNQMVIYTTNHLSANELANRLVANQKLLDNVSLTYLSSEISAKLVANSLKCVGIAVGFSAVWYLVSLNIVSILPIAFSQFLFALLFLAMAGISRVPFDLNSIAILIIMFMMVSGSTIMVVSQLKNNWNKHENLKIEDFKTMIINITSNLNLYQIAMYGFIMLFAVFSAIFASSNLLFTFILLIIIQVACILVNNLFIAILWYWSNIFFNRFTKYLLVVDKPHVKLDYDSVNEQPIRNLNC